MFKIRIIAGLHEQEDKEGKIRQYRPRRYEPRKIDGILYEPDPPEWKGDVFDSERNYAAKWPERFELVNTHTQTELEQRPDESLADYAKRLNEMVAKQQTIENKKAADSQQSQDVPKSSLPPKESAPDFILPVKTKADLMARLNAMTEDALLTLAEDEEVDLGDAQTKEEIVSILASVKKER